MVPVRGGGGGGCGRMHVQEEPAHISSSAVERSGVFGPVQLRPSPPGPHGQLTCETVVSALLVASGGSVVAFLIRLLDENLWELLALTMAAGLKTKKKRSCLFCGGEPLTRKADVPMYL